MSTVFPHGYTDHEHLDSVGLIHMNGRVYDPTISRFVSAAPFVQFPEYSQSLNRYSYVLNNPLSFTDPSGLFIDIFDPFEEVVDFADDVIGDVAQFVADNPQAIIGVAVGVITGGAAYVALGKTLLAGAVGGFTGGLIVSGGDLEAALVGAATGAAFGYIGGSRFFGPIRETTFSRVVAHGVVGSTSAELQSGKFGSGFVSAGFAKYASQYVPTNVAVGTTVTAVIGGTVSRITGGKFASGAVTAAFGYLFNSALSGTIQGEGRSLVDDLRTLGRGVVRALGNGISGLALLLRGDTPEGVYLFRVVDDVELGSIMATKSFSIRPAGFQQKQFFPGIEDARFFATEGLARLGLRWMFQLFKRPYL